MILEHMSLISPLLCSSWLWERSSPQAAIWKGKEEWRYAWGGTSGPRLVCTDMKYDWWQFYSHLSIYIHLNPCFIGVQTACYAALFWILSNDGLLYMWWSQTDEWGRSCISLKTYQTVHGTVGLNSFITLWLQTILFIKL